MCSDRKIKMEKEVLRRMFVSFAIVCLLLLSEGGSRGVGPNVTKLYRVIQQVMG